MEKIVIEFSPNTVLISGIRSCIENISEHFGFNNEDRYQIKTIIDELCSNAIEHGTANKKNNIVLECAIDKNKIDIRVKNLGSKKFDLKNILEKHRDLKLKNADSEKMAKRGCGLFIVNKLSDKLEVHFNNNETEVRVLKKK